MTNLVECSVNSAYFKRHININMCYFCAKYVKSSRTELVECNSCIKYFTKQDSQSFIQCISCSSCWEFYGFCMEPNTLKCPFLECDLWLLSI